jgi:uncharacterized protein
MARLTGKFVWFECVTPEAARAKAFYGELIGWKIQPFTMGEQSYDMLTAGDEPVGGYSRPEDQPSAGNRPHWTSYVSVDDVDATAKKIVAEGGKIVDEAFDVPTIGRMARVADPQGATFWIMAGTGDDSPDAPPAQGRFYWNELWARDGEDATRFYQKVFGYTDKPMEMPEGNYHVLEAAGIPRAGIMTSPKTEVPPMWLPYVAVDDCNATVARAEKLGGAVHVPPTDVPGIGRFAILADPLGATFGVIKPAS